MDDLLGTFLPQFVSLARTRLRQAIGIAVERQVDRLPVVIRDLHTLAGEAGLLGLAEVVPVARDCEHKAKALQVARGDGDIEALVTALRQLEQLVERIAAKK